MAQRISTSQIHSKLQQARQKQQQAINKFNRSVRQYNQNVRQAINKYNQAVRSHNARIIANRQRLKSELARLSRQSISKKFVVYSTSVQLLYQSYNSFEQIAETQQWDSRYHRMLDLSEQEVANSLKVTNSILGTGPESEDEYLHMVQDTALNKQLREISENLDSRWQGAVFALNPSNPDAARHFCISAREIITQIIDIKAPDEKVLSLLPNCAVTKRGKPTRRSKIKYFLHRKGIEEATLEEFVEQDLGNLMELFNILNSATHGLAGKFDFHKLGVIKKRVEDGIKFLDEIIGQSE